MTNTNNAPPLPEPLRNALDRLGRHGQVLGALLIGSLAAGELTPASDYDLVVVVDMVEPAWYVGVTELGGRFADIVFVAGHALTQIQALDAPVTHDHALAPVLRPPRRALAARLDGGEPLAPTPACCGVAGQVWGGGSDAERAMSVIRHIVLDTNVFVALAEAAGAELVTNDAHLLDHRHALRVPVLTPRACWEAWVRGADVGDGEREAPRRTHDDD
jgi:predicted nucleotidyltransferase